MACGVKKQFMFINYVPLAIRLLFCAVRFHKFSNTNSFYVLFFLITQKSVTVRGLNIAANLISLLIDSVEKINYRYNICMIVVS